MSKNLVNGDSLKKYHVGVNTPHVSDVLVNENVTSFKVGTSNVTNVDLSNQMDESIVALDNIVGKTENRTIPLKNISIKSHLDNIILRSVPNGVCDSFNNGKKTCRIKSYTFTGDENWVFIRSNGNKYTYGFTKTDMLKNNSTTNNQITMNCDKFDTYAPSELDTNDFDKVGISSSLNWNHIYFSVEKGLNSADSLKDYLKREIITVEYMCDEYDEYYDIGYFCNPGDMINTHSPLPFTCSHIVQLNTKAQVEELQSNSKSIWKKIKECTDVSMKLDTNGYIKLPTIMGGLILQWGAHSGSFNNGLFALDGKYNIPFQNKAYFMSNSTTHGGGYEELDIRTHSRSLDNSTYRFQAKQVGEWQGNNAYSGSWFAIGR